MMAVIEEDEIVQTVLERKLFTSDEVHRMTEIGILPEESGWELINGEIIHHTTIESGRIGAVIKLSKLLERLIKIEVSFSTLKFDREIKKKIYAEAGIVEFWLVNLENNTVETYSNPKNGNYFEMKIYERDDVILFKHIENLKLRVADIIPEEEK